MGYLRRSRRAAARALYEKFGKQSVLISPAFSSGQCDADGKGEEEASVDLDVIFIHFTQQ